ncbi:MAG: hypothetical protein R3A79_01480 [Nannocystaceae bacterium]
MNLERLAFLGFCGVGLAAMTTLGGCGSECLDDGIAWTQKTEACGVASATDSATDSTTGATESASATETMSASATETASAGSESASATMGSASMTATATATDTASASATNTGGGDVWCVDADMDGFGDPEMCIPAEPGEEPPPGYVPNDGDCDDSSAFTYPGAAELDDPEACMKDEDEDGYGEDEPGNPDVVPGTDCDDMDSATFPGAAPNDDPEACMKDFDDDDWGDDDPMTPGVVPGSDCDDEDAATFPGAAEIENPDACMKDEDDDGWGDTSVPPGVAVGSDCYDLSPDLNPSNTVLFSVLDNNQGDIGQVDEMSGQVTDYGQVDLGGYQGGWQVISAAVNPADGVVFGTNSAQQRLVTFDYCADTVPTNLMPHGRTICGIAFNAEGDLYGIDGGNDELVTMNPATGEVTDAKPITLDGQPVNIGACGMAYDCVSTRLLVSDGTQSRILSIDPSDGTTTVVADVDEGSWNSVGLEFDPVSKDVFTNDGTTFYQIKIDGSNDFVQLPNLSQSLNDLGYGPVCM